ncbi:Testis-expressed sequence 11 protein [Diaporthe amygdali]|uniref:Testis-expressed sequence 11 protein n=1 Tax=Phomopsis amygdali TaxID=1214568 RepID=UPI0022FDF9CF|nr:Testis-expressed sequence 11 protein [Diaporthe amygdali]KAJ0124698.1 Testis-expressed sequence 11 protein [Diaporthe amygdali]
MPKALNTADGGDAATGKSKRKEAILSFVSDLRRRLPTDKDDSAASETLLRDVEKQNQLLDRYSDKPHHGMLLDEDLDTEATKLWNVCTRLGRENADKPARSSAGLKLILWSRVLAFHILHLCQWSTKCTVPVASHLMELALRMARLCIDGNDVQNARTVLQKAADYHGRLQNLLRTMEPEDINQSIEMEAEWTVLRIALAWRDSQLDVAEHLFAQANSFLDKIKPATSEKIIDIYFLIGKSMLSKEDFSMAEKWLQRAWDSLHGQRLQELPRDAVELRMAILQSLVTALLGLRTSESNERAQNLVTYIESEVGDQPIVLVLRLEILNRSPAEVFDSEAYGNILRRMIRSVQLSETSFKLLAHHIRRVYSKSPGLGCTILDEFLISLIKSGQGSWIDKAVVTRIFMTTTQRDFARSIYEAEKSLSRLEHPVSTDASFSAQTLIWKKIEANYSQVRSGDRESAAVHLEAVAKASPAHLHLLYACVADSQQVKDRLIAIDALKKLANVYDFQHPGPVHLPALLRCTIMLLHGLLESGDEAQQHLVVADLCASFDTAMAAQKAPEDSNGLEVAADLSLKSIFCNFLISSALVALARSQDNLEEQLQDYLIMRRHIAAADSEIQKRMESQSLDEVASKDLLNKLALLLSFDFEATVALKCWPDLGEIVLKAGACQNTESFKTMADCILRTPVPPEELFSVLRKIINEISALQDRDSSKLAKYTRCLFQAVAPSNDDLAGRLLDEACRMTSDAHGTPAAWPPEEIEWLASAAYNHSIDLWGRHERTRCTWWAQKAMSIAHFCDDEGHLEKTLQGKYANLKLDVDGD